MYDNKIILEPQWKSWIIETSTPLLTPEQCRIVIDCGKKQPPQTAQVGMGAEGGGTDTKKRVTTISWIPFNALPELYHTLDEFIQKANLNHFGFDDIRITEQAQFTEYPEGGFYDWHMDSDVVMAHQPPVRKISMTLLLNDPSEFEGGDLELISPGRFKPIKQGHAICFASFLNHRVNPVKRGVRQSLVVWFGGKPFR
jgi:PKHD-type hydroxylase